MPRMSLELPAFARAKIQAPRLRPGLIERDVLYQNRLREHVEGIRVSGKALVQQGLGIRIFFCERRLIQAINKGVKKLFFLGSHESNLRRSSNIAYAASRD